MQQLFMLWTTFAFLLHGSLHIFICIFLEIRFETISSLYCQASFYILSCVFCFSRSYDFELVLDDNYYIRHINLWKTRSTRKGGIQWRHHTTTGKTSSRTLNGTEHSGKKNGRDAIRKQDIIESYKVINDEF
jgi:hypothetical protein